MSGTISRAHYNDISNAKRETKQAAQIKDSYITKSGKSSKMSADWRFFDTTEEAQAYADGMNTRYPKTHYAIVS